jgi:peroxiredoxin
MTELIDDIEQEEKKSNGRNPLLLFGGFAILGIALALLLFGSNLFGAEEAESEGETAVLQQVPDFNTASGVARLPSGNEALTVGDLAHDFKLQDLGGNSVSLTDFRGQPLIINFWATWCPPCLIEMPELQASFEKYKEDGLVILALDQDESAEVVRSFFHDEFGLTFTPLLDVDQAVAGQYGVLNFPSSFFINGDGIITAIHRGPALQAQIDDYLAETIQ